MLDVKLTCTLARDVTKIARAIAEAGDALPRSGSSFIAKPDRVGNVDVK
jgi:hypothetical protein